MIKKINKRIILMHLLDFLIFGTVVGLFLGFNWSQLTKEPQRALTFSFIMVCSAVGVWFVQKLELKKSLGLFVFIISGVFWLCNLVGINLSAWGLALGGALTISGSFIRPYIQRLRARKELTYAGKD